MALVFFDLVGEPSFTGTVGPIEYVPIHLSMVKVTMHTSQEVMTEVTS
jgi:hypothetical protein